MPQSPDPASIPPPAVDVENLEFGWDEAPLLRIDRLQVAPRERVFLSGSSGSGKSTLLGLIAGVLLPRGGVVRVAGTAVQTLPPGERDRFRGAHIGFIFQMFNLIPYLDVLGNVLLPLRFSHDRRARLDEVEPQEEARRLLSALGIAQLASSRRPVTRLSMGQQQRVAAARALIGRPGLLIADEPTSSLDAEARGDFLRLLMAECRAGGSALLFVSHDVSLAPLFDRVVALTEINHVAGAAAEAPPCQY